MGQLIPLEDLTPEMRRAVKPGSSGWVAYAKRMEAENNLAPGTLSRARFDVAPGSDALQMLADAAQDRSGGQRAPTTRDGAAAVPSAAEAEGKPYTSPAGPAPDYGPAAGQPWHENLLAGIGKSLNDTWLGLRQLTGNATQAEVDEAAKRDAPLSDTWAGVAGQAAGTVMQMLLPGAGVAKGAAALRALKPASTVLKVAASPVTQAAGLSAADGALQPVTSGGSRTANAVESGALGGGITAGGAGVKALGTAAAAASPELQALAARASELGTRLRAAQVSPALGTQAATKFGDAMPLGGSAALASEQQGQFNRALSRTIGADTDNPLQALREARGELGKKFTQLNTNNHVQVEPWHVDAMTDTINDFAKRDTSPGKALTQRLRAQRDAIVNSTDPQGVIAGPDYQVMRSDLGALANSGEATPSFRTAADNFKTILDKAFDSGLSPADMELKNTIRRQWGNMKSLEGIAPTSPEGDFDFAKLATGLGSKTRSNAANRNALLLGTGNQELPELANIGTEFLKRGVTGTPAGPAEWTARLAKSAAKPVGVGTVGGGLYALNAHNDDPHPVGKTLAELAAALSLGAAGGRTMNSRWMLQGASPLRLLGNTTMQASPAAVGALNAERNALPPDSEESGT